MNVYEDGKVYGLFNPEKEKFEGGLIVGAGLATNKDGDYDLVLEVEIDSEVKSPRDGVGELLPDGKDAAIVYNKVSGWLETNPDREPTGSKISRRLIGDLIGEDIPAGEESFFRLSEDHEDSISKKLIGKRVFVKTRVYNGKLYWDLHIPRKAPPLPKLATLVAYARAKSAEPAEGEVPF